MPETAYVLKPEVVRSFIDQLDNLKIHPHFAAYLGLTKEAERWQTNKDLSFDTESFYDHFFKITMDGDQNMVIDGSEKEYLVPFTNPHARNIWRSDNQPQQVSPGTAGRSAASVGLNNVVDIDIEAKTYSLKDNHWELAKDCLTYEQKVPVEPVAGFLYRDYGFQPKDDGSKPTLEDLVEFFRYEFGFNPDDTAQDTAFNHLFSSDSGTETDDLFEQIETDEPFEEFEHDEWDLTDYSSSTSKTQISRSNSKIRDLTAIDLGYQQATGAAIETDSDDIDAISSETSFDDDNVEMWLQSLKRKKQIIFYGPPGTGKTFIAKQIAEQLTDETDGFWDLVQFHQSYEYEDFIQGLRPKTDNNGHLTYDLQPGTFLEFCEKARSRDSPCFLILDEINRADISSVFGELMYLLEYRDDEIQLSQHTDGDDADTFSIPENVYLFGTMNTADRSIALVDFALRRRFAFIPLYPNYDVLSDYYTGTGTDVSDLIDKLREINKEIDDRQYELGFTYFLDVDLPEELPNIWKLEIEPYLEEYFVDDPSTVDTYRWNKVKSDISL